MPSHSRGRPRLTIPFALRALAFLALFTIAGFTPVTAQEVAPTEIPVVEPTAVPDEIPPDEQVAVAAVLCNDGLCTDLGDRIGGMEITATNSDTGEFIDSCVTTTETQTQACVLAIPPATTFELGWDQSKAPEGYLPFGEPFIVDGGPGGPITYLGFFPNPDQQPPEERLTYANAVLCDDPDCDTIDEYLLDFEIFVVDQHTGEVYDSCLTDANNPDVSCALTYPDYADVIYQGDKDAVPDGYVRNPKNGLLGDPPVVTLRYVPETAPVNPTPTPKAPVTALPSTGTTGPVAAGIGADLAMATLAVLATVAVTGAGLVLTRKPRR